MESKAREGAQFDACGESPPQKTGSGFQSGENVGGARSAFHSRYVHFRVGKFPVNMYVRYEDLFQTRVVDFADEQLGKFLFDAVFDAFDSNSRWHSLSTYYGSRITVS